MRIGCPLAVAVVVIHISHCFTPEEEEYAMAADGLKPHRQSELCGKPEGLAAYTRVVKLRQMTRT